MAIINKKKTEIDMIDMLINSSKDQYSFSDIVELSSCLNREISIPFELDEGVAGAVGNVIRYWNRMDDEQNIPKENRTPIKIYIDCYGGNLTEAFGVVDVIANSVTPVHTIVAGCAYSGAFLIAAAGHKRFCYPHASYMFHEGNSMFGGDANKFVNFTAFYKKQLEQMKSIVMKYTAIDAEKYHEIKHDDFWMTAEEAFEYKVVDEIMEKDV